MVNADGAKPTAALAPSPEKPKRKRRRAASKAEIGRAHV